MAEVGDREINVRDGVFLAVYWCFFHNKNKNVHVPPDQKKTLSISHLRPFYDGED